MLKPSTTELQLREARKRIAALERELQLLRAATPPPPNSPKSAQPTSHPCATNPPATIMTRRAAAAAAVAAAATSDTTSVLSPTTSASPSPSPSPLLCSAAAPHYSELSSVDPREHASSCDSAPVASRTQPRCTSKPQQPSETKSVLSIETNQVSHCSKRQTTLTSHSTPPRPRGSPPPSSPPPSNTKSPATATNHSTTCNNHTTNHTASHPRTNSSSNNNNKHNNKHKHKSTTSKTATVPRRRPPPLPVAKTTCTKKEKVHLVAKCTEPRPGQTRYWTEDEHERFLEAVAEYGEKAYVAISNYVETRTPKQVRTHAQKFQMKMARLARQCIEAGQPIHMPAGMRPVIEMELGNKCTIVTITADQTIKLASKCAADISDIDPNIVSALSASQSQYQSQLMKRAALRAAREAKAVKGEDALVKQSSTVTEEDISSLTDPYLHYIGTGADSKDDMEIENTFAAKLTQTLQESQEKEGGKEGGESYLMSEGSSDEAGSSGADEDELEDLDKLEDGDLALASFSNMDLV